MPRPGNPRRSARPVQGDLFDDPMARADDRREERAAPQAGPSALTEAQYRRLVSDRILAAYGYLPRQAAAPGEDRPAAPHWTATATTDQLAALEAARWANPDIRACRIRAGMVPPDR